MDGTTPTIGPADVLERAAELIEQTPGTNALDANREAVMGFVASERITTPADADRLAADTYYALLDYLPPDVDMVGPWSDRETSDRVAGKMRGCARTIRRGGPVHVDATVPPVGADVVDIATNRNRGVDHHMRPHKTPPTGLAALTYERGIVASAIMRAKRAAHPNAAKLTANEIRLAELDRQIAELEAAGQADNGDGARTG